MYGLIGKKLGHSFSAEFFNTKFKNEGINDVYKLFPLPDIKDFEKLILSFPDLVGLNVTIPYKEEIIPFLDSLSEEAKAIGAVNVIKFIKNSGKTILKGYNTDVIGFENSLVPLINPDIKEALVLGCGGASKAVAYVLNKIGLKFLVVSRSPKLGQINYSDLNENIIKECLLIVNTTPLGMYPEFDQFPPIPYDFLTPRHVLFDLVYNPTVTEFMRKGAKAGAAVKNGLEMLHLQALAAWEIWNDR